MADEEIQRAEQALGMRVPPVWAARAATGARNRLGWLHARTTPGFGLVLERLYGLVDNKALYCAVDLDIPDLLADGPRSAEEIAEAAGADVDAVGRLLRYLVSRDLFTTTREGRYANNAATEVLREDHPYSWRDWVRFFGSDWNWQIWNEMPARVRDGRPAADVAFGVGFFDYLTTQNPAAGKEFNGAMAAGSRLQGLLFAEAVDLDQFSHVCDVGGGTGSILAHLLRARPGLVGTVLDLPSLERDAAAVLDAAGVGDRATFVGGDFFDSVPERCDLYTLFAIVHDWDDDDCVRILDNVREAMAPGGRVMVIEKLVPPGNGYDLAKAVDMIMLVLGDGGRERTEAEYEALFARAGLDLRRRITLPSLFDVFELA